MERECISNSLIIKTIQGKGSLISSRVRLPPPRSNEAIIRNSHIAQNTIDVENLDAGKSVEGTVLGCDFVGYVESTGSRVSKLKEGDLIAGLIPGGEQASHGAYSEYTIADEDLCFKIPANLDPEEAVTVPLGSCLSQMGLFSKSCLDIDPKMGPGATLLVWGGSACVGRYAIQLASLFRIRVIATCGPWNFDVLKALGAAHVLDYRDNHLLERIAELAPDLEYIFDTIGTSTTTAATLSGELLRGRGNLCALRFNDDYASGVEGGTRLSDVRVWRAFLHDHGGVDGVDGGRVSRMPSVDDHELAARLFHSLPRWLNDGFIKPNHPRVLKGGLQAVTGGFEKDRAEGPLDYKIVYQI